MELFDKLTEEHIDFIKDQKVFFVATGVAEGTINPVSYTHLTLPPIYSV